MDEYWEKLMLDKNNQTDQNNGKDFFEKILVFTPDQKKTKTVQKMSELASLLYGYHKPFVYAFNETEFLAHLEPQTLVVSDLDPAQKIGEQLFSKGVSYFLSWENFLQYFSNLFSLQTFSQSPVVCLTFIEPSFANVLRGLFSLYGFEVCVANDFQTAKKILKMNTPLDKKADKDFSVDYFIFNLDGMPNQKKEYEQLLKDFRQMVKLNSSVAVSLVKDFSKGSLYEDILSKIKEINNILLTKEEYILFILRYLQEFRSYELFAQTFHQLDSEWLVRRKQKPYLDKKRFSLLLRDGKSLYNNFSQTANVEKKKRIWLEHHNAMNQLLLRKLFSDWLNTYFEFTDEKRKRGSFTFVGATETEDFAETVKKINSMNRKENFDLLNDQANSAEDNDIPKYN